MKVKFITRDEESLADYDYRSFLRIEVDGETAFEVSEGEPEDANLSRDFNDCLSIDDLMTAAYTAGCLGETLEIEWITEED